MTRPRKTEQTGAEQPKPKRRRPMPMRPSHLVLIAGADGLRLFSAHHTAGAAETVIAQMEALLAVSGHVITVIEVPESEGIASLPAIPLKPIAALQAAPTAGPYGARVLSPLPAPKPAPFRRQSQDEFQAETIAMMNGEASIDGIPMRDADAPLSDEGAMGL